MFVKDLARLCLVDPLVATIFFFRGCTQPCGFGYRRRICMARHLRRWPFPVSNVCGLLPQHSADATPEPIRMLSTPPKGCRRVHRPVFCVCLCLSCGGLVICGRKAAASSSDHPVGLSEQPTHHWTSLTCNYLVLVPWHFSWLELHDSRCAFVRLNEYQTRGHEIATSRHPFS